MYAVCAGVFNDQIFGPRNFVYTSTKHDHIVPTGQGVHTYIHTYIHVMPTDSAVLNNYKSNIG